MPTALDILNDPALRPSAGGTGFQTALDRCPLGLEDLPDHLAMVAVGELRRVWVAALLDALLAEVGHREWFGDVARALGVVSRRLYRAEFDEAITIKETTMTQPQMGFPAARRGQGLTPEQAAASRPARYDAVGPPSLQGVGLKAPTPKPLTAEELESLNKFREALGGKPVSAPEADSATPSRTEEASVAASIDAAIERAGVPGVAAVVEAEHRRLVRERFDRLREKVRQAREQACLAEHLKADVIDDLIDFLEEPADFAMAAKPDDPSNDPVDHIADEVRDARMDPSWSERLNAGIARASAAAAAPSAAEAIREAIAAMPGDFTVNDVWERAQEARPGMARENVANLIRAQVDAKALWVVKPGGRGVAGVYRRAGGAGATGGGA